ncbi:MAG: S-layer homology domain-containing protein [Anaeromicrobium sp.]|jgi:hypothetical protein|uniref:S-layer homology domain-containing protein n=1 Tax=Anaeromicrobium sp. TaxID=1929132 RepID=UPI0025DD8253|nr:S-layer homology domain-containing protein [Anaeromicrobium sp.]MCT4593285.1 S-layer homology domain-containing protein [Anaeromicrobium sp.]
MKIKKIISLILILIFSLTNVAYATDVGISWNGNAFGDEPWYPGKDHKGELTIYNNEFKSIKVHNISVAILDIKKNNNIVSKESSYYMELKNDFSKNMYIAIKDRNKNIFSKNTLNYLMKNPVRLNYTVNKGKPLKLDYVIFMDENAPNSLQGLDVDMEFRFNVEQDGGSDTPSNGGSSETITPICDWSHDCIKTLLAKGIINGYPSIKLHPETSMTRAEVAVVLANSLKLKPVDRLFSGYVDALPKWARGHIIAVSDAGVFKGYPGFLFKPNKNITREEIVTVLIRAFNIKSEKNIMLQFTDTEDISHWAYKYVKIGVEKGILVGYPDKSFKPHAYVSRAEAFTIVCKLLGYHDEHVKTK